MRFQANWTSSASCVLWLPLGASCYWRPIFVSSIILSDEEHFTLNWAKLRKITLDRRESTSISRETDASPKSDCLVCCVVEKQNRALQDGSIHCHTMREYRWNARDLRKSLNFALIESACKIMWFNTIRLFSMGFLKSKLYVVRRTITIQDPEKIASLTK